MAQYIGVKVIESAQLMTKQEYWDIRGWADPGNEDPNEQVYLVEYEPREGEVPNLKGYEGYVSMSPKAVFEEAYYSLDTPETDLAPTGVPHQDRVRAEALELSEKSLKLQTFVYGENPIFVGLEKEEKIRLKNQLLVMTAYLVILVERISNFK